MMNFFSFQPIFLHIIDNNKDLTAKDFCGVVLQKKSCCKPGPDFEWLVEIDNGPPLLTEREHSNETFNLVQITDIHFDPKYEPFGNADCNEPTCCRLGQNDPKKSRRKAGFWGDYNRCDTPFYSVVDAFNAVNAHSRVRK